MKKITTLSQRYGPHWRAACATAVSAAALLVAGCSGGSGGISAPSIIEAFIETQATQVGGATTAVAYYEDGTATAWTLYSMADRFAITKVGIAKDTVYELRAPGYIESIKVVTGYAGQDYALLSMGGKGIGLVNITNPAAPVYLRTMSVNYAPPAYTYSDGGGTVFTEAATDPATPLTNGPVHDVLVDDSDGTAGATPDDKIYIANGAYGIQKTKLSDLMAAATDGPITIDLADSTANAWTLKYSGENPNGGPLSLNKHGGKLYAALGFLGIGIYDPVTLARTGAYNLYADCTNTAQEDWFGFPKRKIACPDASLDAATNVVAGGVDPDGMPTYLQAANELGNKNGLTWYPWAEFDRYGKYYYNARKVEMVDLPGGKTMAYIAYSLGGLVALDVTAAPTYAGYVPAAPAHGPTEAPINVDKKGILSHFGSGMLKEAGVMDVRVVPDAVGSANYKAYYTDHFAGLVVASGAEAPATQWRQGTFNNNNDARVFWPDYEFVKSYDMTPVPVGDESMPAFLVGDANGNYTAPVKLVTGEINGHGGALFLLPGRDVAAANQVDLVESSGAGGVSFVDIKTLTGTVAAVTDRFAVPVNLVSTNEIGAAIDGSPTQAISIGHAEGATVAGNFLYLADGPHGVSVWRIANGATPIDTLRLVANTLADEYPTPGVNVTPTPHAFKVSFSSDPNKAYVMSQSLGMRRIDVSAVNNGTAMEGAPALLNAYQNVFEHNTEAGSIGDVIGQDHAYGVTFSGKYAIVADGDNGLTVYDTTATPGTAASVAANIGDSNDTASGKPPVGRAATVKLWRNTATGKTYAVVAAGAYGISVVDMTAFLASGNKADLTRANSLVKTFEPLKSDDDNAFGSADGKSVDIHIIGDVAYFSYDSFGLGAYRMSDLIAPPTDINPLCTDPTKLSAKQGGPAECRPPLAGYYKLQKDTSNPAFATMDGGALYMTPQYFPANTPFVDWTGSVVTLAQPRLLFYVAYGAAGVVKLDWSNLGAPSLMAIKGVVGGAVGTAINNGRVYVPAGSGGLVVLKK
ncbi:MAG TPA: hypothetical protein PK497_05460 [Burkholderiaceae bacterium]|nr:hypothetical protein [Burkholderiaceae bacterium]